MKLVYTNAAHTYWYYRTGETAGKRCKSVSAVAKIPTDTYAIEQWHQRQVAIGLAMDPNLIENVAVDIDNRDAINTICAKAKEVASAHRAADRGTQMHRVLELVLLDQEHKLLTEQQRQDADMLKRTLDRHKLQPYDGLVEQFVIWPHQLVAGRFDAILEKPDGTLVLTDLKSGPNAVAYPHSTAIQLALYARAPHLSDNTHTVGDKSTVTDWRVMPDRLQRDYAYVLLTPPDADTGTLHRIDIEHGWHAASMALAIVNWRKEHNGGKDIAQEIAPPLTPCEQVAAATSLPALRQLWAQARAAGQLTEAFQDAALERAKHIKG